MLQNETKHHKMTNISEIAGKHEANKPRCYRIQLDAILRTKELEVLMEFFNRTTMT